MYPVKARWLARPDSGAGHKSVRGNAHAVEAGAGFVWVGCCQSPSLLLKVSPDLGAVEEIRFPRGMYGLHDLAFDPPFLWAAHASGHISRIDPRTGAIHSFPVAMASGQKAFLYSLVADEDALWAGTYTDPGCVLRIDRDTGAYREIPIPAAPMWSLRTLLSGQGLLWAGLYTSPGKIVALDKLSGESSLLDLGEENMLITSSTYDGSCAWFGLDTQPARLVRVDPHGLEWSCLTLDRRSSCVRGLVCDGRYLWAGLYTEPGQLVRVDPCTGAWEAHTMPEDYFHVRDLVVDRDRLWAVTQNVRYQPSGLYGIQLKKGELPCRPAKR